MKRKFFIGSIGDPNGGYDDENWKRCIEGKAHVMHQDTKHKGVFNSVKTGSVFFLKYKSKLIAYGEVSTIENPEDGSFDGWNMRVNVKEWFFFEKDKKEGVWNYGVQENTLYGDQMATIKEITSSFGLQKMKEINDNTELFKTVEKEFNQDKNMEETEQLLISNHNLILTGAPGTGKTYLAKRIAQQMSEQEQNDPRKLLEQIIGLFKHSDEETEKMHKLRDSFLQRFPIEKLKDLTLEQYCIGDGNRDNFCWWIERGLTKFGKYSPGSSKSYLVYKNKESSDYVFSGFLRKKKESDVNVSNESLMKDLALEISECVEKQKNINNYLGDSFFLKILSTYYPNAYFPINSKTYLNNVIAIFGLKNSEDILEKNNVVYNFYKTICKDRNDITVDEFAYILYSNFNLKTGGIIDPLKQCESKDDYGFVQFHPSYDYTDFVEGLRPIKDDKGNLGFERKDGVFKEFCINALNNPNKNYVFIIDEINRGEISKIFGELFFSIDPGYRGEKGKVRTQYANMQTTPNDFDDKLGIIDDNNFGHFFIPENVYIIGTMNDIDRSVESMDFAFRRRFAFKEIKADENLEMLEELGKLKDEAIERMKRLNAEISKIEGLSSAYHIGAAYFLKLKNYVSDAADGFENLWNNHLEGLLREYLRGSLNIEESIAKLEAAYNNESPENIG